MNRHPATGELMLSVALQSRPLAISVGSVLMLLGVLITAVTVRDFVNYDPPRPFDSTYVPWTTPNASVVWRDGAIQPGLPMVPVTMGEFRKHMASNAPFVVSLWSGWLSGRTLGGHEEVVPGSVYYIGQKVGTGVWLVASEQIKQSCGDYKCSTTFVGNNSFKTVVSSERSYMDSGGTLNGFILVGVIGLALMFAAGAVFRHIYNDPNVWYRL